MVTIIRMLLLLFAFFYTSNAIATYGSQLCKNTQDYDCYIVKRGDTWAKLFPNQREYDLEIRLNRLGNELQPGMRIAIPKDIDSASAMDYAPFPRQITPPGEKIIVVSISELAWGAYDERGDLVHWGPVSTAKGYCPDMRRNCNTVTGKFAMYSKQGAHCVSTKFPIPRGGAPMPYCMFFHKGFAMHGSNDVPGYNASHGCVRMLVEDASIKAVVIQAAEGRAFCAGGDVRSAYQRGLAKDASLGDFFRDEYRLDSRIYHYSKPYIALLDGITMGGGVGISINGAHRVATERLVFAMPETGIGFFPDVGASYFLTRLPGKSRFFNSLGYGF